MGPKVPQNDVHLQEGEEAAVVGRVTSGLGALVPLERLSSEPEPKVFCAIHLRTGKIKGFRTNLS